MTFLPIVERELRVAARKRFTYWGRFSAAALALLIFGGMQTIFMLEPPSGGPSVGLDSVSVHEMVLLCLRQLWPASF